MIQTLHPKDLPVLPNGPIPHGIGSHLDHRVELLTGQGIDGAGPVTIESNELSALRRWSRPATREALHLVPAHQRLVGNLFRQERRTTENQKPHKSILLPHRTSAEPNRHRRTPGGKGPGTSQ